MKTDKKKKEKNEHRNNDLDPNNNKNLEDHKTVVRNGKRVKDDGFEHRKSNETT